MVLDGAPVRVALGLVHSNLDFGFLAEANYLLLLFHKGLDLGLETDSGLETEKHGSCWIVMHYWVLTGAPCRIFFH